MPSRGDIIKVKTISLDDIPLHHRDAYWLLRDGLYENKGDGWKTTRIAKTYLGV